MNVDSKRLASVLAVAYDRQFRNFADLVLLENVGPRTLQTLAMVAEVVHGTPVRFSDPARYSFALGGKDGHPFPIPIKTYDAAIDVLRHSVDAAKLSGREKLDGMRRLNRFVLQVEQHVQPEVDVSAVIDHEKGISASLGGRTAADSKRVKARQLTLFS